jgi:hypothetical protein
MLFRGARAVAYQAAGHRKFTKAEDAGKAWRSANAARCSLREKKNESTLITGPPTWSLVALTRHRVRNQRWHAATRFKAQANGRRLTGPALARLPGLGLSG